MVIVPGADRAQARQNVIAAPRACLVLVVDRQPLFLDAFATLLEGQPLAASVRKTCRSDAALEIIALEPVDLVVCDVRVEPVPWPELGAALALKSRPPPLVLLADTEDEKLLLEALGSTVAGLFTKDVGLDEFLAGVMAVLAGHRAVGGNLMRSLLGRLENPGRTAPPSPALERLSATERDILRMLAQARSIAEIASTRSVSSKTVRNHVSSIYRKLHLNSRVEAMLWAVRTGLAG